MSNVILMPSPYYPDPDTNNPISNGFVYIGEPNTDPTIEGNRIDVTITEQDGNEVVIQPADQPLTLGSGGVVIFNSSPIAQMVVDTNYSMTVLRSDETTAYYFPDAGVPNLVNNIQNSSYTYLTGVSGTNILTASASPSLSRYVVGQLFHLTPPNANTGPVTLDINSLGAGAIQLGGDALIADDIGAGIPIQVQVTSVTPTFAMIGNGKFKTQDVVPEGTRMLFMQNEAPFGWTFLATNDDMVILGTDVESEGGTSGGSWTITGLTMAHDHEVSGSTGAENPAAVMNGQAGINATIAKNHDHSISITTSAASTDDVVSDGAWRPAYVKAITCERD